MLVTALVKQRRAFRMRNNKVCHSIGLPYPNPYLRQGHQLYDDSYRFETLQESTHFYNALIATKLYPHLSFLKLFSSDTTQMADAMQIPTVLSVTEEKERLTVLQIAASVGPKTECRFPSTRATIADLLDLLQVSNHLTCFCYITH
jgi:hypothetical protein